MLDHLLADGLLTDRKQRLFGCACVRRVWHLIADGSGHRAVEAAEGFADALVSPGYLVEARGVALEAAHARAALALPGTPNSYSVLAAAAGTAWEFRAGVDPLRD